MRMRIRSGIQSFLFGKYYRKSLILALIIACLPSLLIGIGADLIGRRQIEQQVTAAHQRQLLYTTKQLNDSLSHIELILAQWANNPIFGLSLKTAFDLYDYAYIRDVFKTLQIVNRESPLIKQAYLYVDQPQSLVSGDRGIIQIEDADEQAAFHDLLGQKFTAFWNERLMAYPGSPDEWVPTVVYKLPVSSSSAFAALVIYLDPAKLNDLIQAGEESQASFLMDSGGSPIVQGGGVADLRNALRTAVLKQGVPSEPFVFQWQNAGYLVSCSPMSRLNSKWVYVSVTPLNNLYEPVIVASRLILSVGLVGLFIAMILSVIASSRIYLPIRRLFKQLSEEGRAAQETGGLNELQWIESNWKEHLVEKEKLKSRLEKQLPMMRDGFMLQLLQGHLSFYTEKELREQMAQMGWETEDRRFVVMTVHVVHVESYSDRFLEGDGQLISFAVGNIVKEVAGQREHAFEVVNFLDLSSGLLLMPDRDIADERVKVSLFRLASEISNQVAASMKINVAVGIGKLYPNVKDIPSGFAEARQAIQYRDLDKHQQILDISDYVMEDSRRIDYPFALENELIQAVRSRQEHHITRLLGEFYDELKNQAGQEYLFQQGLLQLLFNLRSELLKMGFNPYSEDVGSLADQLQTLREKDEIAAWFWHNLIGAYFEKAEKLSETVARSIRLQMDEIIGMIRDRFHEELSLDQVAEAFNLNPFTLSKTFKQITGVGYAEYVTRLRILKAKELLAHTDLFVNDIAGQVGYQPTYFNRVFKRFEGMTPLEYRKRSQG